MARGWGRAHYHGRRNLMLFLFLGLSLVFLVMFMAAKAITHE